MIKKIKESLNELLAQPLLHKYRLIILPMLAALICILLIIMVIMPHIFSLIKYNQLLEATKQKYDTLNKKLNILKQTDKSSYQDDVQTTLLALPAEKDIPGALGQLLFLLGSNNLQVENVSLTAGEESKTNEVQSYPITLNVTGDTSGLKNFLLKVKNTPRILKVNQLQVTGGRASGSIEATIGLTIFFQPLPQTIGNIEQPLSPPTADEKALLSEIQSNQKAVPVVGTAAVSGTKGKQDPFQ